MRHICIFLIRIYQVVLSPLVRLTSGPGGCCRFTPSCSAYGIQAFRRHGTLRGGWLTALRLLRCAPWGGTGWDPVPETFRWKHWPTGDGGPPPGTEPCPGHPHGDEGKEEPAGFSPHTRLRRPT
jgi:putative membrane protein insertion efficiency factor